MAPPAGSKQALRASSSAVNDRARQIAPLPKRYLHQQQEESPSALPQVNGQFEAGQAVPIEVDSNSDPAKAGGIGPTALPQGRRLSIGSPSLATPVSRFNFAERLSSSNDDDDSMCYCYFYALSFTRARSLVYAF